jgi:hypothetical protein
MQALPPNPESFLLPHRRLRRQRTAAAISVLASLLFVIAAAFYFKDRLDILAIASHSDVSWERVSGEPSVAPGAPDRPPDDRALSTARDALTPTPAAVAAPEEKKERAPAAAAPAQTNDVAPRAAPRAEPPARSSSFELRITSKPSRATVIEEGRALGKTPLTLTISANSVASAPRAFVVHLPGHIPVEIVRGPSQSNVNASVVLQPRPLSVDSPDAGPLEDDLEPARPGSPRARRKDLGIRLRR